MIEAILSTRSEIDDFKPLLLLVTPSERDVKICDIQLLRINVK